jgi:hypothetical protein
MNKSLDNKEETTYRRAKERKAQKKHERVIGYMKNMVNQRQHRNNLHHLFLLPLPQREGKRKSLPEGKPSSGHKSGKTSSIIILIPPVSPNSSVELSWNSNF